MLDAKLQLKPGKTVAVLDAPAQPLLKARQASAEEADAALVYVRTRAELEARLPFLREVAGRGALAWVAYPKARALGTDLNRDAIHDLLRAWGLDCVRQIAVDGTWSAMRFKPLAT